MPLIEASAGGAFVLFTSHRALARAADLLRARWAELGEFPLLVQGEAPREQLLRRFRESGNAVLLGTASFWEGVDVKGDALRLVIIEKLPFASPDDALTKARIEHLKAEGRNAFREYQLPEAALALKQGVGRLIRSETDRGVVVICDPRLVDKPYGRVLRAALPPMPVTREAFDAEKFLRRIAGTAVSAGRRASCANPSRTTPVRVTNGSSHEDPRDRHRDRGLFGVARGRRPSARSLRRARARSRGATAADGAGTAGRGRRHARSRWMRSRSGAVRAVSRACVSPRASRRGWRSDRASASCRSPISRPSRSESFAERPAAMRALVVNDARMREVYWCAFGRRRQSRCRSGPNAWGRKSRSSCRMPRRPGSPQVAA